MKIVVCVKQVPDTNEVRIDEKKGTLIREGVPSIMNPDDKGGLEAALHIKDANPGTTVTALSMGPAQAEAVLREALAMGADEAVLVSDAAFAGADTLATSRTLAAAIQTLPYDLIITGRQAIDGDTAQVGPQIAEYLNLPHISYVEALETTADGVRAHRQFEDRYHVVTCQMPCLLTVLTELNTPRYMTPGGVFDAYRDHDIQVLRLSDLQLDKDHVGLSGSPTRVVRSFPKTGRSAGERIDTDPDAAVEYIIDRLKERFLI